MNNNVLLNQKILQISLLIVSKVTAFMCKKPKPNTSDDTSRWGPPDDTGQMKPPVDVDQSPSDKSIRCIRRYTYQTILEKHILDMSKTIFLVLNHLFHSTNSLRIKLMILASLWVGNLQFSHVCIVYRALDNLLLYHL